MAGNYGPNGLGNGQNVGKDCANPYPVEKGYDKGYAKGHEEGKGIGFAQGVQKGDRVAIYMPMVLELPIAMLACARIGAMHSVVFGGFSAEALAQRIVHSGSKILVTADGVMRATKFIELKGIADDAMEISAAEGNAIETCIVYERNAAGMPAPVAMQAGRDTTWAGMPAALRS